MPISRRKSCLECRAAKARCSRDPTCFRCVERGLTCNYGPTLPRSTPYSRPADYTSRIGHMVSENVDQVTGPLADPAPADNERRPPLGSDSIDSYDMDPAPDQERWPRGVWLSDDQFIAGIDSTWSEDLIPVLPTEDTFRRFTAQPVEPMNEGQSDSRFGRFRDGDLFNHQQPGPFARIANTQLAESSFGRNHVFSILGNNCRMVSGTQFDIIAKPKRAITGSSFLTTQVLLSQVREYPTSLTTIGLYQVESYDSATLLAASQASMIYVLLQAQRASSASRDELKFMISCLVDLLVRLHESSVYKSDIYSIEPLNEPEWALLESTRRSSEGIPIISDLVAASDSGTDLETISLEDEMFGKVVEWCQAMDGFGTLVWMAVLLDK
ncbi:hypothetical protein G7054_g1457 [Neopestalotiopsis clavispora]|nr:hypothetical protein G7054_g1457 [Neopestalotiopsis clavispora]